MNERVHITNVDRKQSLTDTPDLIASSLALVLSPKVTRFSTDGPTNVIPLSAQAWAKSAFSDKNPYPGWIASTLFFLATSIMFSMLR